MASGTQRRTALVAALGFVLLDPSTTELPLVDSWLSNWTGTGLIAARMARQDFDLQLTRYDERGWRATFYSAGIEHSVRHHNRTSARLGHVLVRRAD